MPEQLYIGNFSKGLSTGRKPFNIDNDSFPLLWNFYIWRGRAKKKRGTDLLGQLQIQVASVASGPAPYQVGPIMTLSGGAGSVNLISHFSLPSTSTIVPGSFHLSDGVNTYTDNSRGILTGTPAGSGTINYSTSVLTITGGNASGVVRGSFGYYPTLPVMGLEDYFPPVPEDDSSGNLRYPLLIAFDTEKAYQLNQTVFPYFFYNISYYKITGNPVTWSGTDYQLFWSTNYSNAFWATNNKPGLNFVNGTYVSGSGTSIITFTFTSSGPFQTLVLNDKLWFNEWNSGGSTINGITGTVSTIVNATTGTYAVTFTGSQTVAGTGIAQLLTNSIDGQDGIKWYDGDPTNGTGLLVNPATGWVNFAPPLTATSLGGSTALANLPAGLYYLVGAQAILPFKKHLLFFGVWVQIAGQAPINLQDTVIWSWIGTPYYAAPVPVNQTFDVTAYYLDVTGKGGYISAGISQPIVTINANEDVLLIGFTRIQSRFVYTGNDLYPFVYFTINSELGASSTFSGISLDRGALTFGTYGIALTDQQSSQRVDLDIPDAVFSIRSQDSGPLRVNGIRDFFREWVYFSFPVVSSQWKFPTNTLMYNYRENTWSVLYENYTKHGNFYRQSGLTWEDYTEIVWEDWDQPWSSGISSTFFPRIIAGNPQGYVLILDADTREAQSGTVQSIAASGSPSGQTTTITSVNHCVNSANTFVDGDYLYFSGLLGLKTSTITAITTGKPTIIATVNTFLIDTNVTISGVVGVESLNGNTYEIIAVSGTSITINADTTGETYSSGGTVTSAFNGLVGLVISTPTSDTFEVDIPFPQFTTAYLGGGQYARLCQPLMQTKQFPLYWDQGRQVRLGRQQYLLERTSNGQVTLNIYLSQDDSTVWNQGPITPYVPPNPVDGFVTNSSLEYSQLLYTCPESTNLGLTPANTNLQSPTASSQNSIWHRINTSLQGESVQVGITLNEAQMKNPEWATSEITLNAINLTVSPGPTLS